MRKFDYDVVGLRSKSWAEFAKPGAPDLDFVFTVCDNAAGEACPLWPGQPITAHWGIPDPAAAKAARPRIALAFKDAYRMLKRRIDLFLALPIEKLDRLVLHLAAEGNRPQRRRDGKRPSMSTFERYLTVWVALCIVAGIALGHVMPGVFQAIGGAEIAKVNLPVGGADLADDRPDAGQDRFRRARHACANTGAASASRCSSTGR